MAKTVRTETSDRAILNSRQKSDGGNGAEQGAKHILLCVPGVALRSEKTDCGIATDQSCPPFDQLIEGADGQTNAHDQEWLPAFSVQDLQPDKDFAGNDGRHKTLHNMAKAIVVVTMPAEDRLKPVE